ncbi:probable E3 ubiquitin-protein ligase Hul4p [[Candida] jaroonii]|uniref:Probable E3 ubiquitin-protein ligase Hul4p n=1 Tax=[Candida] jaroonii TaxID=467808 RepID=A0ACA9Y700_9ASCO|nr:probable E3 ubiquitin-protein ligase Hul4p [[Candida] jaroonii]
MKEPEFSVINCTCCSTIVSYPQHSTKFRCSVCETTNILTHFEDYFHEFDQGKELHFISSKYVKKTIEKCLNGSSSPKPHEIFEPLSKYLYNSFRSYSCLNNSFKVNRNSKKIHYNKTNIDFEDIFHTFNLLINLPTKRPLFNALKGCLELLKRVPVTFGEDARNYSWLLMLLEIPFLSYALSHFENDDNGLVINVKEIKFQSYEISKRVLGIISNIQSVKVKNYFISWFSKYSVKSFVTKVDLINVYITFHLKRLFTIINSKSPRKSKPQSKILESDNLEVMDEELKESTIHLNKSKKTDSFTKIKLYQYGNDWHIKTSSMVLKLFVSSYNMRSDELHYSIFYNSLVDYVNLRMDFDAWVSNNKAAEHKNKDLPELSTILSYIKGDSNCYSDSATYFFSKYPYLITLGNKIMILEYEAKRLMERKAEEAFINSLDKKIPLDIYFRIRVRRNNIIQDSLSHIKLNQQNLKKGLKIQFVNEPGIDGGGLRKEWFHLIIDEILNPRKGLVSNIDESNFLWFHLLPHNTNQEYYFLLGAILGLAIYNSNILNLKFPLAFYKILLNLPIGFSDFQQIYPQSSSNLMKLKELSPEDLEALELTFEITLLDVEGNHVTRNLIPNGDRVRVNCSNLNDYIEKYAKFHIHDGITIPMNQLLKGFKSVTNGNGLSLFAPEEIKLLLCGDDESKLDIDILRSIINYKPEAAKEYAIVEWFWDYLQSLNFSQQRKFLIFVTGSDRIPATGIQNMIFSIKVIAYDSEKLPLSHTCFNQLDLYRYGTREKLFEKLHKAINESSGFGMK